MCSSVTKSGQRACTCEEISVQIIMVKQKWQEKQRHEDGDDIDAKSGTFFS